MSSVFAPVGYKLAEQIVDRRIDKDMYTFLVEFLAGHLDSDQLALQLRNSASAAYDQLTVNEVEGLQGEESA